MAYGISTTVLAPIGAYDAIHQALLSHGGFTGIGLIVHVGRPTADGFRVIEVWESKERFDHFNTEIFPGILAEVMGDGPPPAPQEFEEFEVRGLVVPGADIAQ